METVVVGVRAKLLSIPGSWGPRVVGLEEQVDAVETLKLMIDETLDDLGTLADDILGLELEGDTAN